MLSARDASRLDQVARECSARGGRAEGIPADVAKEEDCKRLVGRAVARFGRIDALVNNAGFSTWARFDQIEDLSILQRIMQVSYMGEVYCTV